MERILDGRRAVVTGATSGIGRATAQRFAAAGARVLAVGRNATALEGLARVGDGALVPHAADVTVEQDRAGIVEAAAALGGIDVLVNAAGILEPGGLETTPLAAFDRTMDLNVRALYDLTRRALPALLAARGNVVNVSSVAGPRAFPGMVAYCTSKAAVDQITRCLALELADRGVRVNAVNPGVVITEIHRRGGMSDEAYAAFLERSRVTHPIGRVGTPEEVAELILYLASERAAWVTGATWEIDGGRGVTCLR